ncbi:MAG: hypothetical protein KF889_25515 [Alphaproteobacteria bacterium]|nr:hypothetical protein [Alphaproteobacteria bacterium]MCW5739646.1 hypothetical protein [Alphaproteobacteria bacterium]
MGRMIDHTKARERDRMRRSGVEQFDPAALASPPKRNRNGPKQLARCKTIFAAPGQLANSGWKQSGDSALAAWQRRRKQKRLAEEAVRAEMAEIIEHIPAPRVEVSPQRAAELQEREWIGPTQTNLVTGKVTHLRRFLRDGRYVTERFNGPAP